MAYATVSVGDPTKATDLNNVINALLNMLTSDGYLSSQAPAAAGSTGTAGTITYESGFLYVCVATDTWQRVAIATWP